MNDDFRGPELAADAELMNCCRAVIDTIFTHLLASLFSFCGVLH